MSKGRTFVQFGEQVLSNEDAVLIAKMHLEVWLSRKMNNLKIEDLNRMENMKYSNNIEEYKNFREIKSGQEDKIEFREDYHWLQIRNLSVYHRDKKTRRQKQTQYRAPARSNRRKVKQVEPEFSSPIKESVPHPFNSLSYHVQPIDQVHGFSQNKCTEPHFFGNGGFGIQQTAGSRGTQNQSEAKQHSSPQSAFSDYWAMVKFLKIVLICCETTDSEKTIKKLEKYSIFFPEKVFQPQTNQFEETQLGYDEYQSNSIFDFWNQQEFPGTSNGHGEYGYY
ncbi:hypothetical protein CAEBREN_10827 [Caenorhabditis brenneri]|uniref:Uncharacterized protein n=1 Tax=Caenorhabditis brenneri TaxID=135651 RepID=G0ND08_CAEBE|nr:hypothetical protein CAEBREN_10827 [Caenorhabditis brenneri]